MSVFSDLYSEIKESCGWETIPYELTAKLGKICTRRDIDFLISEIVRFGNVDLSDDSGDGADELWRLGTSISYILAFAGEKSVGPLLSLLEEGGRFASRYAARSLSLLRAEDALEPLIRKMQNETDIGEQLTYVAALGEIGSPGALPFLLPLLNNSGKQNEAHLVAAAAESIGKIGEAASIKPLGKVLRDDSDWLARLGAAEGLGHIVHPDTVVELKSHLNEPDKRVLEAIHKSLSAIQSQL